MKSLKKHFIDVFSFFKKSPQTLFFLLFLDIFFFQLFGFIYSVYIDKIDIFYQAIGSEAIQKKAEISGSGPNIFTLFFSDSSFLYVGSLLLLLFLFLLSLFIILEGLAMVSFYYSEKKTVHTSTGLLSGFCISVFLLSMLSQVSSLGTIAFFFVCSLSFLTLFLRKQDHKKLIQYAAKRMKKVAIFCVLYFVFETIAFFFYFINTAQTLSTEQPPLLSAIEYTIRFLFLHFFLLCLLFPWSEVKQKYKDQRLLLFLFTSCLLFFLLSWSLGGFLYSTPFVLFLFLLLYVFCFLLIRMVYFSIAKNA